MSEDIDKILKELENDKNGGAASSSADDVLSRIQEERRSKVSGFKLDLNLDGDEPSPPADGAAPAEESSAAGEGPAADGTVPPADKGAPPPSGGDYSWANAPDPDEEPEADPDKDKAVISNKGTIINNGTIQISDNSRKKSVSKKNTKVKVRIKTFSSIIYAVLVLVISVVLACVCITGGIDMVGLNKSEQKIDVIVPEGATTKEVAQILKKNGIIDHPFIFELYSKFMNKDGTYKPHGENNPATLSPSMGYNGVIAQLQSGKAREVVSVVIPEGYTVDAIAAELESKGVCAASDFYASMKSDTFDYDFINNLPPNGDDDGENRIYKLEGYLFPDTYEFYTDSSAKSVITKFLDNFDTRIDTTVRSSIKASGRNVTLDQIITLASIIQAEAADEPDMAGVSRVLWNRLDNPDRFPKLECDSTWIYIDKIIEQPETVTPQQEAYYTYVREGLPVGAICNPGMAAIKAAISPSDDPKITPCFYFASAKVNGEFVTFYSKTQQEHDKIRQKYNLYK